MGKQNYERTLQSLLVMTQLELRQESAGTKLGSARTQLGLTWDSAGAQPTILSDFFLSLVKTSRNCCLVLAVKQKACFKKELYILKK